MASRGYERLAIEEFGRQLITSGDLDPVYIALRKVGWPVDQVSRWLIAYWCFYHCGFASHASTFAGNAFWRIMQQAASNETVSPVGGRWPRGSERRHARGVQGFNMVRDLRERYGSSPHGMVEYISGDPRHNVQPFQHVAARAKDHTLFGPWIAFKIADMLERVNGVKINFENAHVFMFKDPAKAAVMLWRQRMNLPDNARPRDLNTVTAHIVDYLIEQFSDLKAPPTNDRPIGLQEVETVLCKYKSHMNGHYPLFNDIDEIRHGLVGWGPAADEFAMAMPKGSDG